MKSDDFPNQPLFHWIKTCAQICGVRTALRKMASVSGAGRAEQSDDRIRSSESVDEAISVDYCSNDECANHLMTHAGAADYLDLCNGILLYACILYIDSSSGTCSIEAEDSLSAEEHSGQSLVRRELFAACSPSSSDKLSITISGDVGGRLQNLRALMRRIQRFYLETLNALVVMPLPDLLLIARNPFPEASGEEMKKVLLLLLGCAVQSDKKEEFIRKIKELDLSLQQAIVEQIKKVTDTVDCVLNVQALELDPSDRTTATVLHQLQRVISERDAYANSVLELAGSAHAEHESDGGSTSSASSGQSICNGDLCQRKLPESQQNVNDDAAERRHQAFQLSELNTKLRRTRQELNDKIEILEEYRNELRDKETQLAKLHQDKMELVKDARLAKGYRDELDVLREQLVHKERLEQDCGRYKERLNEFDYYKGRVEELREQNNVLEENRHMLEKQLDALNVRLQKSSAAETELIQAQRTVLDLQQELKSEREKVGELLEQNIQLEKDCQESLNKSSSLEKQLHDARTGAGQSSPSTPRLNHGPLSDQLHEGANAKLLKLELDNQRLKALLAEFGVSETATVEDAGRQQQQQPQQQPQRFQKENEQLKKKLEQAQQRNEEFESLLKQSQTLERNCRQLEERYRGEIDDLRLENTSLTDELTAVRDRFEQSLIDERQRMAQDFEGKFQSMRKETDELRARKDEVVGENRNLAQELARIKTELSRSQDRLLEHDKEKLTVDNRLYSLDREARCAEKENAKLKQMLDAVEQDYEKLRTRLVELERENHKLESSQKRLQKSEASAVELEVEKRHLAQQAELESKKSNALREDLIKEKTLSRELSAKLQSILNSLGVVGLDCTSSDASSLADADALAHQHLSSLKSEREQLRGKVDELELRERQVDERLTSQSSELETLRRRLEDAGRQAGAAVDDQTVQSLNKQLSELASENKNVKQQVYLLQEQLRKAQNHYQTGATENGVLRQEINDLKLQMNSNSSAQSDNAKLQVELRSLQLQVDVLEQDNNELQKQNGMMDHECGTLRREFEQLQRQHSGLLTDHEQLQMLHEQLTNDFEKMQNELMLLRAQMRQMKHGCLEHNGQLERLTAENERLINQQNRFDQDRQEKEREIKTLALLQNEHSLIKKAFDDLQARYDFLTNELEHIRSDYRNLRLEYNACTMKSMQLQGELADTRELAQRKDIEAVKLANKCDTLTQLNSTLDEESRTLLRHMDSLVNKNQELLTRALTDKELYHAEEKELQEKMNALRRHKEKLEEKIMEQYKSMDSPSKRKEKSTFIKKAKALVSRPSTRKSRPTQPTSQCSAADDSALSADEGGFGNGGSASCQNGKLTRLHGRAESVDRRSQSSGRTQTPSEYIDYLRVNYPNKQLGGFAQEQPVSYASSPLNSPITSQKRSHSSASTPGAESSLSGSGTSSGGATYQTPVKSNFDNGQQQRLEPPPLTTLPPFAPSSCTGLVADRISLAGSERAVDVPTEYLPQRQATTSAAAPPPPPVAADAAKPPPPYVPPRGANGNLAPPPSSALPPKPRHGSDGDQTVMALIGVNGNAQKGRPPPPPYPGPTVRRAQPPLPLTMALTGSREQPVSGAGTVRFRSEPPPNQDDLVVYANSSSCDSFAPAQTSTPKSDQRFVFDSAAADDDVQPLTNGRREQHQHQHQHHHHPHQPISVGDLMGNGQSPPVSGRFPVVSTATKVNGQPSTGYDCRPQYASTTAQQAPMGNSQRRAVHSVYENVDGLAAAMTASQHQKLAGQNGDVNNRSSPDGASLLAADSGVSETSLLAEIADGRDANSVWYEYGCV